MVGYSIYIPVGVGPLVKKALETYIDKHSESKEDNEKLAMLIAKIDTAEKKWHAKYDKLVFSC